MTIDPNNPIVQLCAQGMLMEGEGKFNEAAQAFMLAWSKASNDYERLIAAHYVARRQTSVADKLTWDIQALEAAIRVSDDKARGAYPSLYLNIAKCYEDLGEYDLAHKNYQAAQSSASSLAEDGYGKMIRSGINAGLARIVGFVAM